MWCLWERVRHTLAHKSRYVGLGRERINYVFCVYRVYLCSDRMSIASLIGSFRAMRANTTNVQILWFFDRLSTLNIHDPQWLGMSHRALSLVAGIGDELHYIDRKLEVSNGNNFGRGNFSI